MNIAEVRRKNLQTLIQVYGSDTRLSSRLGMGSDWLVEILSGKSLVNDQDARAIEQKLHLQPGGFDQELRRKRPLVDQIQALDQDQQKHVQALIRSLLSVNSSPALSAEETELLSYFRQADPKAKEVLLRFAKAQVF